MKPGEYGSGESEVCGEEVEECGVGNGVEGCREIQYTDAAYISTGGVRRNLWLVMC